MRYFNVKVNGKRYEVEVEEVGGSNSHTSSSQVVQVAPQAIVEANADKPSMSGSINIEAPMQGKIIAIKVSEGEIIKEGDVVAVLEAMKMENEITASKGGVVVSIEVASGQMVEVGDVIISLE